MFNSYVWQQKFFGDYHEMAHIWARIQAFDQVFKIRILFKPAAKVCFKSFVT